MFRKYNVPYPKPDWTYYDFVKTAKELTHEPNVFGVSFEEEPLFYLPYLTSFGLNSLPKFEDSQTQIGLNKYADLRNKYKVAPKKKILQVLQWHKCFAREVGDASFRQMVSSKIS